MNLSGIYPLFNIPSIISNNNAYYSNYSSVLRCKEVLY